MKVPSQPPVRRRSRLLPGFGLLFVLSLWLVPSSALAAEIGQYPDGDTYYEAGSGETNHVVVEHSGGAWTFTESGTVIDSGDPVPLTDGDDDGGCEVTGNVATCPAVENGYLSIYADDGDDRVNVGGEIAADAYLYGGEGDDALHSAGGRDYLSGGTDDDTLQAGGGSDDVSGSAGNDAIDGGDGNDFLDDGAGDDVIDAGDGNDEFYGDFGDDVFNGEGGDDFFNGIDSAGADVFSGGSGTDWLDYRRVRPLTASLDDVANDGEHCPGVDCEGDNARSDIETLSGGDANDTLIGNDGPNVLAGEPGTDTIHGHGGDDELAGDWGWSPYPLGAGDDILDGGSGNDSLFGDFGADSLTGGPGVDSLDGDAGNDTLNSADGGGRDSDECGGGTDTVTGDGVDVVAADCETVFGAIAGGPQAPEGAPAPAGQGGSLARPGRVIRVRATRTKGRLRVTGVATTAGRVKITARKAGRVIGSAQRTVPAGRRFALTIAAGKRVSGGRYTLTTTLRPHDGRTWTATKQVRVR
jgi:Ca2+-binding RTX toxin-like protein